MIHFSGRRHTPLGIASAIIGIAIIIGFIVLSVLSAMNRGQGGIILGIMGLVLFALSILGFVISYKAMKEKDIFYLYPIIGTITNGVMIVFLFILYVVGLV